MEQPKQHPFSPPDLMSALLKDTPSLIEQFQALVGPVHAERDTIRRHFLEDGSITTLGTDTAPYTVGCTDGALIVNPLALGDHLFTFAVALAQYDGDSGVGVVAHHLWSELRAHSSDSQTLAQAVMMTDEIALLPQLPHTDMVRIIDGSWPTHLASVLSGLASPEDHVRDTVCAAIENRGLIEAVEHAANSPLVVACPKSDSSTELWRQCAERVTLPVRGLSDKVLASLILEDGEVLISDRSTPPWLRMSMVHGQVRDRDAKRIADRLIAAAEPLRQGRGAVVTAKPYGSAQALRIETRPGLDPFDVDAVVQSVCATVHSPHIQEPLSQFLADLEAKRVSPASQVQMETLRLHLSATHDMGYFEYLVRQYRTS